MSSVTVIQARTSSSRLPGKVLLPVGGIPIAVLAARRAANTGRNVMVATSWEKSDDILADSLLHFGIKTYRGSLQRVLDRVVGALSNYSDSTIVIRLTADNVVPDGRLIDELEAEFISQRLDYLCCNGYESGLPYGVSAELTRLGHLREAACCSNNLADQEHVTPYVIRKYGKKIFKRYAGLNKGHYRCTVDSFDDYLNVCDLFRGVEDPIAIGSLQLVDRLSRGVYQPSTTSPVSDMVLGTAQLGMNYGIVNSQGVPVQEKSSIMLKTAISNGVIYVDTARSYGNSEEVIGSILSKGWGGRAKIITKLSTLSKCSVESNNEEVKAHVDASIYRSCKELGVSSLDVLLLHRAEHFRMWGGVVWEQVLKLQKEGVVGDLGVSIQSPEELEDIIEEPEVRYLQLPFNILDCRWGEAVERMDQVKKKRPLIVHVRSSLLQGLLISKNHKHWKMAGIDNPEEIWAWLDKSLCISGCRSVADLCIRYVRSQSWADGVVVGMESLEQIENNLMSFDAPVLESEVLRRIDSLRPVVEDRILDPSRWSKK